MGASFAIHLRAVTRGVTSGDEIPRLPVTHGLELDPVLSPTHLHRKQSLTELAVALSVSKASISTVIRPVREGGLVERLPAPTRRHHYRLTPGGFTRVLQVQLARMRTGMEAAEFGLSVVGNDRSEQRRHLEELRDFCEFSATVVRDEFMRRWEEYRATKEE